MSSTTVEPRFAGGPTLPEIAGVIAGIIALAIALAPTLSHRYRDDASGGTPARQVLAPVDAAPGPEAGLPALEAVPGEGLPAAGEGGAATHRCSAGVLDGDPATPGAFCALPPREAAPEETHVVNLSFPWPPGRVADER